MAPRLELHSLLKNLLGLDNVYFQPPNNITLNYPCIIYKRDSAITIFADDNPYHHKKRYQVTIIDPNPDHETYDKIAALPLCTFDRFYTADNLNHDVFNIFF